MAKVVLTGDKALNRKLARLQTTAAKKIVRKAARPALRPVLDKARELAPEDEGDLARSLKIRAIKRSRSKFGAQVQTAKGNFQGETFYGGFQEWGWKTGKRGSSGRRQVEGQHFMLRAAVEMQAQALRIYRRLIAQGLIREARK